jgi:hypothetical protein
MAIPAGAHTVHYSVRQMNDMLEPPVDFAVNFTMPLYNRPEVADAAAQAAAEAAIAYLRAATPEVPVTANRYYELATTGDSWPNLPAEEPAAEN